MENNEVVTPEVEAAEVEAAEVEAAVEAPAAPEPAPEAAPESAPAPEAPAAPAKRKLPDFGKRVGSAIIYAIITIGCILWGNLPCAIMLALTAGICCYEYCKMMGADHRLLNDPVCIGIAAAYPFAAYLFGLGGMGVLTVLLMLTLLVWFVLRQDARIEDACVSALGPLYTGMLLSCLMLVRPELPGFLGGLLVFVILLSVWANDVFAYLVGCKFGKHRLAPKISPKKSVEGFVAGLVGSVAVWQLTLLIPHLRIFWWEALIFGLVCGVMAVLGDLVESRIKRNCGVKDSGTIMPGHGGLLDRTDSILFVSATSALLLNLFGCFAVFMSCCGMML